MARELTKTDRLLLLVIVVLGLLLAEVLTNGALSGLLPVPPDDMIVLGG